MDNIESTVGEVDVIKATATDEEIAAAIEQIGAERADAGDRSGE